MGTNNINRTLASPHPMYGIRPTFNISDLSRESGGFKILALTNITAATVSIPQTPGARFLSIIPTITDPAVSFDIDLYTWNGSTATKVYTFTGASVYNPNSQAIFMGGFEGVDLQGGAFKLGASNVVNPNTSNFSIAYEVNG